MSVAEHLLHASGSTGTKSEVTVHNPGLCMYCFNYPSFDCIYDVLLLRAGSKYWSQGTPMRWCTPPNSTPHLSDCHGAALGYTRDQQGNSSNGEAKPTKDR